MVELAPGMRIVIRDEEWMVRKVETNSMGNKAVHCAGISPLVKDSEAIFLTDLEQITIVNPAEVTLVKDTSPYFRKSRLYIESLWRQKIPTDTALHIGYKAAMDLMPYQLEPAQIALRRPRQRILIADAVGLGKTLEAGILMSELIARGKGKRILVVTIKSMMAQFQKEMWNRFTIPLVRLDSVRIQKIRAELPSNHNPFFRYDKTIVSIDTLKRDVEYRTHLENAYWDIIVIDEAQNVAERGAQMAQRSRLAALLAERSDTMIMLSATPHDGRAVSFASLMNMLDPTAIADQNAYTHDDIKGLFIRRFKKELKNQIGSAFEDRVTHFERCFASAQEEKAFKIFSEMRLDMDLAKRRGSGQLFKTSLEKALFSSPVACIKSIDERLSKLQRKYPHGEIKDIALLRELKNALEEITPKDFSRYQTLLKLLSDKDYAWRREAVDDRIVIFTERIETMKYLATNLRRDLKMSDSAVKEIYGGLSDIEQQKIVEDFGREDSPIRILVASDVASEGLNLHYLSHRLIHFDIPWSLMVFQQRNGRIDRYGQKHRPDIRYMIIQSKTPKIKGDVHIIEILVEKEEQAAKNIGDPAMLLGKYNVEDEEQEVAEAIESGAGAQAFEKKLESGGDKFNAMEMLMAAATNAALKTPAQKRTDETLLSDKSYLAASLRLINQRERCPVNELQSVSGLDVFLTSDMKMRLKELLPPEVMPKGEYLRLSDDKAFVMEDMARSMQNNLESSVWPSVQYLWKLHPLFLWVNDKARLFFRRGEAPVSSSEKLSKGSILFIVTGNIPNKKSMPLVDEWFGVLYQDGNFVKTMSMSDAVRLAGIDDMNAPNPDALTDAHLDDASRLLHGTVAHAKEYLNGFYEKYISDTTPLLDEELNKLIALHEKHRCYQLHLFEEGRAKSDSERKVDALFEKFEQWTKDTMAIENNPYIQIVSVVVGV